MRNFSIIALLLAGLSLQTISCNKKGAVSIFSSANFIHASPGLASFQVFVDTIGPTNNTTVAYGGSSGYIGFIPGSRNVSLENRTATPKSVFAQFADEFEAGKAYSYFISDTADAKGLIKTLRLTDMLTLPAGSNIFVRFLNLAPNAGPMDVTLIRGTQFDSSSTSTQKLAFAPIDSITISSQSYAVSAAHNIAALSEFKYSIAGVTGNALAKAPTIAGIPEFNQNNRYIVKLKAPGTQNVLFQSASVSLQSGRIYTVFARGTARGQALGISVVQHY